MLGLRTYKIVDLYNISSGLSKSRSEFGFGNPFVTFKDVFYNYFLPKELESLANTSDKEIKSCSVRKGDVFLTRTSETADELGMSSVALKDYPKATFNGFTKRLRIKENSQAIIDPVFIGYYFRSSFLRRQFGMHSSMSTRASLNNDAINSIKIEIPEIEIQEKIGSILKSLDDKIELNRRMNQTLEQMAQALFNHYFVDNIDKDNLPEGWRWGNFSDLVKIWSGKSLKRDEFIEMGVYPIYGANGVIGKTNKYLVDKKLLLTGRVGTLGTVQIVQDKIWISDNVLVSEPYFNYNFYFSKFILNSFDFIGLNRGSTQPLITQTDLKNQVVLIPSSKALTHFDKIVSSYYEMIFSNEKENLKLTQIRDTLLPKLMSGEIDVDKLTDEEELIENQLTNCKTA